MLLIFLYVKIHPMLVLDLETKKQFSDVGGQEFADRLGISLVGVYDYVDDKFVAFRENQIDELLGLIKSREKVIGFNIKAFDWKVLQPYAKELFLKNVPTLDLMEDVANFLGFRVGLAALSETNLGETKSGHGLEAIKWYQEGNWELLEKYCLDDVRLTRDLYELGSKQGYLKVLNKNGSTYIVPVRWGREKSDHDILETLRRAQLTRRPVELNYIMPGNNQDPQAKGIFEVNSVLSKKADLRDYSNGKNQEIALVNILNAEIKEVPHTQSLF